jgi:membrane fusion protein, copper/silver efflux system
MKNPLKILLAVTIFGLIISVFSFCKKTDQAPVKAEVDHSNMAGMNDKEAPSAAPTPKKEKKQIYHCPMHPTYTSDKPGDCPICGMKLVPVESDEHEADVKKAAVKEMSAKIDGLTKIKISSEKQQLIGVKTAVVDVRPFNKSVVTFGKVDFVDKNVALVNAKFEGWIEKPFIESTGQIVKKGEPLVSIYSPDLVSTQREYLLALKSKGSDASGGQMLLDSARQRFKLWDISDSQINALEKSGEPTKTMTLNSPIAGFVVEKNVLAGQKIGSGETLFKIADLSKVWIEGEVYEADLSLIKVGQKASISLSYFPEEKFPGNVSYIYPYLNPSTRTNKIRIDALNPQGKMKPDMFANIEIQIDSGVRLSIPVEAVLDYGDKKIVFIDKGEGYFEPREVTLGETAAGDFYEVKSGVVEGEKVVSSANFLIDSESRLKSAIEQMGKPASGHEGHQM